MVIRAQELNLFLHPTDILSVAEILYPAIVYAPGYNLLSITVLEQGVY